MEATRRLMPHDYVYKHPKSEFDFLAQHAMLMPAIASQPEAVELPCTCVPENSQSAQMAQTEYVPNHHLKRALTRYETQQTDAMKVFLSVTVSHPDEEEFCPGPEITSRNGQKRMISRSMTTMRRHFSTWRSSKLATVRKVQAVTENPIVRRCRTVLHKAPPESQMESAKPTGLTRAKRFRSIRKKERPIVTAPTQENFPVFELDSTCITREDVVKRLADTGEAQRTFTDHGVQASMPDAPPSEPLRVSVRPLDMPLDMIPESPELDLGSGYALEDPATMVIEDSNNSSDGSISRGSSNRSTVSGSSYNTNTTVSEVAPASSVDCRDSNNLPVLRSMSQRSELAQLAQNNSVSSLGRSKSSLPSHRNSTLLSYHGSCGGTRPLGGLLAAHRFTRSMHKPRLSDTLPKAIDIRHGLMNNGYRSQFSGQTTEALPDISPGGWSEGTGETHGLQRTFSWRHGDEDLSITRLKPTRKL